MKVVLIGFMGSGKSTIAALLGKMLQLPVIEMDDRIVQQTPYRSARDIFRAHGEEYYRTLERSTVQALREVREGIISTGGGAILRKENQEDLKTHGAVTFFLKTSFETIQSRIGGETDRPLFQDPAFARTLYDSRQKVYEEAADFTIVTDTKTPQQVAEDVIQILTK